MTTSMPRCGRRTGLSLAFWATVATGLAAPAVAQAATYHVEQSGDDAAGDGSQAKPWRSIAKAADAVPGGEDHIIHVGEGTFEEPERIHLKERTTLEGSGIDVTIIKNGNGGYGQSAILLETLKQKAETFTVEGHTEPMRESVDSPQELRGFTLDGKGRTGFTGIKVLNRNKVHIHDVKVQYFKNNGIELVTEGLATMTDIEIDHFEIKDSAEENGSFSLGNIDYNGDFINLRIHDGTIEHMADASGYGIKGRRSWHDRERHGDRLRKSKIYNIYDRGKKDSLNGLANFAFEIWGLPTDEVEIYANDLVNVISLEKNAETESSYSLWVHHNRMKPLRDGVLELANSKMIVEYNYFDFSDNPSWVIMGEFNNGPGIHDVRISNNVFNLGSTQPSMFVFTSKLNNFQFVNNIVYGTGRPTLFEMRRPNSNGSDGIFIKNNVFETSTSETVNLFITVEDADPATPANFVFASNMYNRAPNVPEGGTSTGNIEGTAEWNRKDIMPNPFFEIPSATANVVDKGVDVGLPFSGSAPDLGAFEYGSKPLGVGIGACDNVVIPEPSGAGGGGSGTGSGTGAGAGGGSASGGEGGASPNQADGSEDSGGCQVQPGAVGAGAGATAAWLFAGLGLLAGRARRSRKRLGR